MPDIDLKPIIIFVAILCSLLGSLLLKLHKQSSHYQGIKFWSLGCFTSSASLITVSCYPLPTEYINLLLFNLLIISGQGFILIGIWKFKGKRVNYYFVSSLIIISILQVTYFTIIHPDPGTRMAINSMLYAAYGSYAFFELLKSPDKALKFVFRANSLLYLLYVLIMTIRATRSFSLVQIDFLSFTPVNTIFFILVSGLQLVLAYGFIIMVNTRLAEDLRKQLMVRDKLLSIIAHDLKSSVNVIEGFSELLSNNIENFEIEKSKQFAGYIKQSSIQMSGILANLLNWALSQSRADIFNPVEIDIRELVQEETALINSIASNKKIYINFNEVSAFNVKADRNMLKTILRNLIINAIKYTNPGGVVSISTKVISNSLEVSVNDSGIGIEPDDIPKLFNAHTHITTKGTAHEVGSGLGLMLCKEFVERHKGKIWVESIVEKGSTFRFTIPAHQDS